MAPGAVVSVCKLTSAPASTSIFTFSKPVKIALFKAKSRAGIQLPKLSFFLPHSVEFGLPP